jgi:hypothetical protein
MYRSLTKIWKITFCKTVGTRLLCGQVTEQILAWIMLVKLLKDITTSNKKHLRTVLKNGVEVPI